MQGYVGRGGGHAGVCREGRGLQGICREGRGACRGM